MAGQQLQSDPQSQPQQGQQPPQAAAAKPPQPAMPVVDSVLRARQQVQIETLKEIVAASHPDAPIDSLKTVVGKLADRLERGERTPELMRALSAGFAACTERFGDEIQPEVKRCHALLETARSADAGTQKELSSLRYNFLGITKDKRELLQTPDGGKQRETAGSERAAVDAKIMSALLRADKIVTEAKRESNAGAEDEKSKSAVRGAVGKELSGIQAVLESPQLNDAQRADALLRLAAIYYHAIPAKVCEEQYLATSKSAMKCLASSETAAQRPEAAFALGHIVWNELSVAEYQPLLSAKPEHILPVYTLVLTGLKDAKADLTALTELPKGASAELQAVFDEKRRTILK